MEIASFFSKTWYFKENLNSMQIRKNKKHLENKLQQITTQRAFTCSKLTIETLEQGMKYVQS